MVPALRVTTLVERPVEPAGRFVLYWMTASRRTSWSFSLDRAIDHARTLQKPLLVLEPLRVGYRWASDRFHAFIIQGMGDNAAAFAEAGVAYHPFVEPAAGAGKGLLEALAREACVVVGDDWPCFFHPRMQAAAAKSLARLGRRFEVVDSNGLVPIKAAGDRVYPTAAAFRRFLQAQWPKHLGERPLKDALAQVADLPKTTVPDEVQRRWPAWTDFSGSTSSLASLPIDHDVAPVAIRGGERAARAQLSRFIEAKLARYHEDRSPPDLDGQSGLSPWLHQGHLSVHEVCDAVFRREAFTPERLAPKPTGSREGFWGMSAPAEGFLDELLTWRELGFNMTSRRDDYDRWASLPTWAQQTLIDHLGDERKHVYTLEQLASAQTHDPLWNAAQRQLVHDGVIHNYLRMLWGKKVLEWSKDPRVALEHLIELNNRYAIDGRDPNSYSGIFWVFGRYDRPWGPIRPIFGAIRYMTSDNTMKKHACKKYLQRWGPGAKASSSSSPMPSTPRQPSLV
jgi:deoxyribodipyrimidine photo-lyase